MASAGQRLKVAVVGAGFAHSPDGRERFSVRAHVPAILAQPDKFELTAVCTTRMETARESADHFGVPHAFDDVARMVEALPELDVVCTSVRPAYHHQVVMPALEAGKHVYCELPLGLNSKQAQEMHDLAKKKGVKTVIGYQQHHHPVLLYMSDLVRQGFIGTPLTFCLSEVVSNYIVPRPSHRQWLFQSEMGGQPGYRSGRSFERVRAVLGQEITSISADLSIKVPERAAVDTGGVIKSDQVDNMNYIVQTEGGVTGSMQICYTGWFGSGDRFEVYGTEGMLYLTTDQSAQNWHKETGEGDPVRGTFMLFGSHVDLEKYIADPIAPERLQRDFRPMPVPDEYYKVSGIDEGRAVFMVAQTWAAFHEAIVSGMDCRPNFEDGLKLHRLHDAANKSSKERAWADVDLGGF
ncbi:MAG: Gfo/Idh/MocA family oxidoreductase [Rhodospirillales bacterium]